MSTIRREEQVAANNIPALDPTLLKLSETEVQFLHATVASEDEEMQRRVREVQEDSKYPYPCIRAFHYVNLMMSKNAVYPDIVREGKERGDTLFLDLGCCMGTDVRKLALDGYPARNILGCDLREEYITLGYKLFQDRKKSEIRFLAADIFDVPLTHKPSNADPTSATQLAQLQGSLTHVYTGALFHLFDEATQYAIAARVGVLLKREKGAVVFGRHQGLEDAGMIDDHMKRTRYGHSPTSWPLLWKRVFTELEDAEFAEKRLVVDAKLTENLSGIPGRSSRMLYWSVKIV
ncbi:hypothetical protein JAAARDRAFT_131509 [Jaapia argillacea MUCL 33604]|uniref:Methyltransferase domain-containing protein n=1 Tax=Jaapia argillacea MUCL 33604 TaxID=933084 RepID=A0A067Q142_9AGAM|nr:hypothetical protein JAAARDRAFT_131509 [Jaapia argillacea MUCL 33604]